MLEEFKRYIKETLCLTGAEKMILAVSGGIDSVCMAYLFKNTGFTFAIAHCNYGLRGDESDSDELLIKQLADTFEVPFYSIHFNTKEYAQLQKVSIQVAARELRYSWFENLRRKFNYDFVAVAHNADDAIETFFINLIRGCGINGITGIKARNEHVLRPVLFAHRSEIVEFCTEHNISFRTDSSNLTDKYLRNRIRNSIIPDFEKEAADFKKTMNENLNRFDDAAKLYNFAVEKIISDILNTNEPNKHLVSISKLVESPSPKTILFETLKRYQFSGKTSEDVFFNLAGISGKTFFSNQFRLIKDREYLIICRLDQANDQKYYVDQDTLEIHEPYHMNFSFHDSDGYEFSINKSIADFDADQLVFPLMFRRWQHGDYFKPLGLRNMKKVSDYFTDKKLSLYDKENCWILTSAGEIIWLIGYRIDDRFKITDKTMRVLRVEII